MVGQVATEVHLQRNRVAHDTVAKYYPHLHPEIYNPTEQIRLRQALSDAKDLIPQASRPLTALDMGTGRGNLSTHLLYLGFEVTATDISANCLSNVAQDLIAFGDRLSVSQLNGKDLSSFDDNTFDFAGCYSVLHHVPDYEGMVHEMARVVRPGGVIYIDHEASPNNWEYDQNLSEYWAALSERYPKSAFSKCIGLPVKLWPWYIPRAIYSRWKKLQDPRFSIEGDIHIWPDDHIEWPHIEAALNEAGAKIIERTNYLGCAEMAYPAPVYEAFRGRCENVRKLIAVKT